MAARSRTTVFAAIVVLAAALQAPAQIPLGPEFRVDTLGGATIPFTLGGTTPRASAMSPDGSFVRTWVRTSTGNPYDVVARRFDASGVGQGAEFIVNSHTTGFQYDPSVGVDDAGNFVVVWTSEGQDGSSFGVFGQRFDASGTRLGPEFRVNTTTSSAQFHPSLAMAPGAEFVVVWSSPDGDSLGIFGQRYDASGAPAGGEFQVNTYTTSQQYVPTVDMDDAGNFVVVWTSGGPGVDWGTFGQRFAAGGARQGVEFAVNSDTVGSQARARVARSRNGSFVVAWWGSGAGDYSGIFARRFDASGLPLGTDFRVNEYTTGDQRRLEIDVDADGDFVIAWSSRYQDGSSYGVFGRRFDSAGTGGAEFRANTYTTGRQSDPSVASDPAGNFVVAWLSIPQNGVNGVFAQRYAGGLSAAGLAVDGSAGPTSDGNGVFEAGETVTVAPAWLNANLGAQTFAGTASTFTGPGAPGDPTYTIADGAASYGTVASNATASCTAAADCYALGTTVPSARPAQHWDASFHEQISPANLGAAKNWTLHIGDSFSDVPRANGFYRFVETLLHRGITAGCSLGARNNYCPSAPVTREQMAPLLLLAKEGAGYLPPPCEGAARMFDDVPASNSFCRWIEELARRRIVTGCSRANYCPTVNVSREAMAIFVLLTLDPTINPPNCSPPNIYPDVPESSPFCRWIEELANRGVLADCGGGNYCPAAAVTREQMAVFLSVTFGLLLYGP